MQTAYGRCPWKAVGLYVIDTSQQLSVLEVQNDALVELGRLSLSGQSFATNVRTDKIFVSETVLYIPTDQGFNAGFATVDVSDPAAPTLLSGPDDRALSGTDFADAGNGVGFTVGRLGGVFGTNSVMVVDISDPTVTDGFVTRFDLDDAPTVVNASAGFAYVGDAAGNFHIINALGFDTAGISPTVDFDTSAADADPLTPGLQLEEGRFIQLPVTVTDDRQIQKVELLLDGQVIRTDLSIPYTLQVQVPTLASGATSGALQVRATDTGGNITTTAAANFDIIPDNTPPEIVSIFPPDQGLALPDRVLVRVLFNESIDPASIDLSLISLQDSGGALFLPDSLTLVGQDRIAQFQFGVQPLGSYILNLDLTGVTDVAGNAVGGAPFAQGLELVDATAVWDDPTGGNWTDPLKWRGETLPIETDRVAIVLNESASVTFSGINAEVDGLSLSGDLNLLSGSLETGDFFGSTGVLSLTGGLLRDTVIKGNPEFSVNVANGTFSNVALDVAATVESAFGYLGVENGLTVNGALSVAPSSRRSTLDFRGAQLVDGTGEIELSNSTYANSARVRFVGSQYGVAEALSFGSDLTLRGNGNLYASQSEDRLSILGDLVADGGRLNVTRVDNAGGTLSVDEVNGGQLRLVTIDNGELSVAAGAEVDLAGTHQALTLSGAGVTHLNTSTVNGGLTVAVGATGAIDAVSGGYYGQSSRNASVSDGLVVDGTLEILGSGSSFAQLGLRGAQSVTGTGEIVLGDQDAASYSGNTRSYFSFYGQQSGFEETLEIGADLTLRGAGLVRAIQSEDRLRILGDVVAEGGRLTLQNVDNGGAVLSVSESGIGQLLLTSLTDTDLAVAAGTRADLTGNHSDLTVSGVGVAHLNSGQVDGLTVAAGAEATVDVISGGYTASIFSRSVTIDSALQVDGTLSLVGDTGRTATLRFSEGQEVAGTGTIYLSRANVAPGQVPRNQIDFDGLSSSQAELLSFGEDITIRGSGSLYASRGEDRIQILGTVEGVEDGLLTLQSIDNSDDLGTAQGFEVDASLGRVGLQGRIENAVIDAATGQTGQLDLLSGTLANVDLNIAARVDAETTNRIMSIENGLTLGADLALEGSAARTASLAFRGTQSVDGTGEILMSRTNAIADGQVSNQIYFAGQVSGSPEVLTFGAGITIAGDGRLFTSTQAEDRIEILGTVAGIDGGTLRLDDISNAGQAFAIDASLGVVALEGRLEEAVIDAATGQTGRFEIFSGTLEATTLNIDAGIDAIATSRTLTIENGLTLNNALSLEGVQNRTARLDFTGEQSLDGIGEIVLSRSNALADEAVSNSIRLINTNSSVVETLTIGEDVTIRGQGRLESTRFDDRIDLKGTVRAEDGRLEIGEFDALDGTLAAAADGILEVEETLTMLEQGRLELGIDAGGTGRIEVQGSLTRDGVLALDVDAGFSASLGDTFEFLTTSGTLDGAFQGFEGFDLAGDLAFTIDETANSLTLRVTTDADALADGVFEPFLPGERPPFERTPITLDVIDTTITDSVITGTISGGATVEITSSSTAGLVNSGLEVDAIADGALTSRTLGVHQGLTLNGTLTAAASEFTSVVFTFASGQMVDGTGTIHLSPENALTGRTVNNTLQMTGTLGAGEIVTFGEDITITGQGAVTGAGSTGDALRILGTLAGEGTGLTVSNVDNAGADMVLDTSQGRIFLGGTIRDAGLTGAAGTAVDLSQNMVLDGVELGVDASFGSVSSETVSVFNGLDLTGGSTIALEAGGTAVATLRLFGEGVIGGTGTVLLSTANALSDGVANNDLNFRGLTGGREVLEIGAGITLRGTGEIFSDTTEDVFRILGTVAGEGAGFTIRDIDNAGGTLTIDSSAGQVRLDQEIANAALQGTGQDSMLTLASSAVLDGVTLGLDAKLSGNATAFIENGLAFANDAQLIAASTPGATSTLRFQGEQAVSGQGTVLLSLENAARNGQASNQLDLDGLTTGREMLSFGQDVTIIGQGTLSALDAEDRLEILGTVAGRGTGLVITDLDNAGATITADGALGDVIFSGRIENTAIAGGPVTLASGVVLSNVTLGTDAGLAGRDITLVDGFQLDGTLGFGGTLDNETLVTVIGAQSLTGTGTFSLDDDAATGGTGVNRLRFDGVLTDAETLTLGAGLTLVGEGRVETVDTGDVIDLQGIARAEEGLLEFDGLEVLTGTLSAGAGARVEVENALALDPDSVLEIALNGDGQIGARGRIDVLGLLTLGGTLRLDVGADFNAAIGDEFTILTATGGLQSAFATLEGFDFTGTQGFQLVEDGNDLILRVVEGADIGTVVDRADLPVDPPLPELSGLIQDTTINEAFAGGPAAVVNNGTTFSNVALDVAATVESAFGYLGVENGLTVNGALSVAPSSRRSTLDFRGAQLVDGTGEIELSNSTYANSARVRFVGSQYGVAEALSFGSDLTLRGNGNLYASQSEDRLSILGDLVADGGRLNVTRVDNAGGTLSVDEVNGGQLRLVTIDNGELSVAAGAEVDLAGTHQALTLSGAGVTHLNTSTVNGGLTVAVGATGAIDAVSGAIMGSPRVTHRFPMVWSSMARWRSLGAVRPLRSLVCEARRA